MISYAYLAFKALRTGRDRPGVLLSPVQGTAWAADAQGRPSLVARNWGDEERAGIYAASLKRAAQYGMDIYIVSPSSEGETDDVILGEAGWRARSATVVAGPFLPCDDRDRLAAAQTILAAAEAGYPQLPSILVWAAAEAGLNAIQAIDLGAEIPGPVGDWWDGGEAGDEMGHWYYLIRSTTADEWEANPDIAREVAARLTALIQADWPGVEPRWALRSIPARFRPDQKEAGK